MREAASAACLSIGGLYHYFPRKRELLLYGLNPEAQSFVCRSFGERNAALRVSSPRRYLDAFVDHQVEMAFFVRPSVRAALDMDLPTISRAVERTVSYASGEFAALFAEFVPTAGEGDLERLARAVRRTTLGALLDPSLTTTELRRTLRAIIEGTPLTLDAEANQHASVCGAEPSKLPSSVEPAWAGRRSDRQDVSPAGSGTPSSVSAIRASTTATRLSSGEAPAVTADS